MSETSDTPTSQAAPVCKPTKWFIWRALAMLIMFSVFTVLFLYDGIWGYRDKNLQFYVHANFVEAGKEFQRMQEADGFSEAVWQEHAGKQTYQFPDNAEAVLPEGTDIKMPWADVLVNGYSLMTEKGGQNGASDLWEKYSASKKWAADPGEEPIKASEIRDQFIAAGVALLLILVTLYFLIRTLRRSIRADEQALYTQDGRTIAYGDMVRIDKRKWDTKGLALVYYQEGGEEKKAKIDGMVYGQFKEEDGAPAERLFSYVMERFKGEVIEYVEEEEDETDEPVGENEEK